ncbi:MAG TPA: protocatechuate 3,4-dioxygenase subunit beta [Acidimicrobiales bacterium]|nr:protocatechuate 3,4-dioxygenase subunit beta [Acidimicrobiales bacterium]
MTETIRPDAGAGAPATPLAEVDMRTIDPPYDFPGYRSSALRAPKRPLLVLPRLADRAGPVFGDGIVGPLDNDLTRQHDDAPIGERIIVAGRLLDTGGRPIAGQLIELWQANAAGRYAHAVDDHDAPLDPNFSGYGRTLTDSQGRYRFVTIRPGEYPWGNHLNAWRPAHLHFSVFGRRFEERLVTQMFFPGDPLLAYDPIFNSVSDERARQTMMATLELRLTEPAWAIGYRFDLVVGREALSGGPLAGSPLAGGRLAGLPPSSSPHGNGDKS